MLLFDFWSKIWVRNGRSWAKKGAPIFPKVLWARNYWYDFLKLDHRGYLKMQYERNWRPITKWLWVILVRFLKILVLILLSYHYYISELEDVLVSVGRNIEAFWGEKIRGNHTDTTFYTGKTSKIHRNHFLILQTFEELVRLLHKQRKLWQQQ